MRALAVPANSIPADLEAKWVTAFVRLVEELGAFRTVRVRRLDTDRSADGVPLAPVLRGSAGDALPTDPAEILDHSGRRVVPVLARQFDEAEPLDAVTPLVRGRAYRACPGRSVIRLSRREATHPGSSGWSTATFAAVRCAASDPPACTSATRAARSSSGQRFLGG